MEQGMQDFLTYEIDTNGRDVAFRVGVIGESQEEARLPDTGVSDEEELEKIVVSISNG